MKLPFIVQGSLVFLGLSGLACVSTERSAPSSNNKAPSVPTAPASVVASTPPSPPTAPPVSSGANTVRFVALGDTGTGSASQKRIGNQMAAFCKKRGCDFVQMLGDNLYDSGAASADDPIWQTHFEEPYAAVELEFWAVLGNHDYGNGGAGTDFLRGKNEVQYTAKSKKWKMPSAYWHMAPPSGGGKVEIFGLDTNMALFGKDADQRKDVAGWVKDSKAVWKIAVGHHPYLSNGPHGNAGVYDARFGVTLPMVDGKNVKSYLDDVICGKADLYLSGHDHSRQWLTDTCQGTALAVSGAGSKTTMLGGTNATRFESLGLGFLYIVIDGKTLTAEFIDAEGKTEFTHVLRKP
jgi:tartrate-resistant acid phosphatase type 5